MVVLIVFCPVVVVVVESETATRFHETQILFHGASTSTWKYHDAAADDDDDDDDNYLKQRQELEFYLPTRHS